MVNKGIFRVIFCVLLTSYVEIIPEATISRVFSYPDVGAIFENLFCLEVTNWRMQTLQVLYTHALGHKLNKNTHTE